MKTVLVLGTNFGDRLVNIKRAVEWLACVGRITKFSSFYETPDCYGHGSHYGNAVVELEFSGTEEELTALTKEYEISQGRDETARRERRVPIDVDIVVTDGRVVRQRDFNASYFKKGYGEIIGQPSLDK